MPDIPQFLAFDLGASTGRAVLGTLSDRRMHMDVVHRFDTPIVEEGEHIQWDVDVLWDELRAGLRAALDEAPGIRSVSVDSWGVDYVSLDASGRPTRDPYCYRDPRLDGVMERAFDTLPKEEIYRKTGIYFLPFNTLYQMIADRDEDPDALARVDVHLTVADYFNFRFSGRRAVEVSLASTTQMMDVHTKQWSHDVLHSFGLDADQWPDIVPSGTVLGTLRGRPEVDVVATCSHDTGSAVAAAPVTDPDARWAYVSCGTWSLLGVERRKPVLTADALSTGFTNEAGLDGTIRFLKNLTGLWALQECAREWGDVDWKELEEAARRAAPNTALIDLEDPRFLHRGGMEERLRAYLREHGLPVPDSRAQLARVILESIADSYRRAIVDLERVTDEDVDTIYLFGGGSQNELLCELTAAACGKSVVAGPAEATALGNLLIQARSLGYLPDGTSLREVARRSSILNYYDPILPTD
ncbi:MAG: rhamnulokinase family protein [Rhodothermales bacterium]